MHYVSFRRPIVYELCRLLATMLAVFTLTLVAFAQSESGGGAIQGVVTTSDGKPVANASVSIRNAENGYVRETITDESGQFAALAMPIGGYRVQAKQGEAKSGLITTRVTIGSTQSLKLVVASSSSEPVEIVVHLAPAVIDTKETSLGATVDSRGVQDSPIRGRSFPDFVQLTPDVIQEPDKNGLVISGQRSINSNVAVDGADFNDPLQGNQRGGNDPVFFFPLSAVREFQVVRSGAGAEVGRTGAGFVNAVTKSGTDDLHGDAFYLNRNSALTSSDAFGHSGNNNQNQFGGSIGGPIKKDRFFFFVAAEQNFLSVPYEVQFDAQPTGVTLPDSLLALQGDKQGTNDTTSVFARTDVFLNAHHALSVDYHYAHLGAKNFGYTNRPLDQADTANFGRRGSSNALKASLTSVLSTSFVNDLRAQLATDHRSETQNVDSAMVVINGVGTIGADGSRPRLFDNTRYETTDNVSITKGRHSIRFGVDSNITPESMERELNVSGRYDFTSLANYLAGTISRYRQTVPTGGQDSLIYRGTQHELAFYVQDKLNLLSNLSLTAGLRWEGQWNPQPPNPNVAFAATTRIPNDLNQWQPRLGLAWDPRGNGKTVIRLSSGLYDAHTPGILLQRVFTDNGLTTAVLDSKVDPNLLNMVSFPNPLLSVPTGTKVAPPKVVGIDPHFRNPRSFLASLGIETVVADNYVISLSYTRNSTWALQRRVDTNLFAPTYDSTGMPIFSKVRPNAAIGPYSINQSKAHSSYDGFDVSLQRRMAKHFQFSAGYTLSWSNDDDTQERVFDREPILDPFNPRLERSWSKNDIRHNLRLSGTADLPYHFSVTALTLTHSGLPFTPVIGFDTQNDGNDINDRAIINGKVAARNSMRMDTFLDLDLRIQRAFRLGERSSVNLIADFLNATNNPNKNYGPDSVSNYGAPANPNSTAGQALFAPLPNRFGGTRQVQLGARFEF
jgi:hypothetical protein